MAHLIRYSLLIIISCFSNEKYLYAKEKAGGVRKEEKPVNALAYRSSSNDPLKIKGGFIDNEDVIKEIKAQLATMATKSLVELVGFCKKNAIQGEFVVDLTVEGKGKVLTVFMVSGGEDNIPKKNLLKNKLAALQFDAIKIPKNERVKLRHTFTF